MQLGVLHFRLDIPHVHVIDLQVRRKVMSLKDCLAVLRLSSHCDVRDPGDCA